MTELAVTTHDLDHAYDVERTLRGLTLDVPRGSVFGLLGRNGSGKTTLLRILLGVVRATGGQCQVLGRDPVTDAIAIRTRVGYVPQTCDFDPSMTARQTLDFVRGFYPGTWQDELATALLDRFEVPLGKRVAELSGGHKARLSLVAALAFDPELLILDEPTAGLDAVVRRDFVESVIELMTDEGRTVLLASHQLNEVELLADRVAILEGGRLLVDATVDELKEQLCRVTARFPTPPVRSAFSELVACRPLGDRWQLAAWTRSDEQRRAFVATLERHGATELSFDDTRLESIFVDLVGGGSDA